jgi:hypothetical protein
MGLIHIINAISKKEDETNEKDSYCSVRSIAFFSLWIMLTIFAFFIGFTFLGVFFIVLGLCIVFWLKDNKNESNIS